MNDDQILLVYCTCPDAAVATTLARAAVSERLAACVNQLGAVTSHYIWQGELQASAEIMLIAKTDNAHIDALSARWQALHPYELPEIIAVPVSTGSGAYLAWIRSSLGA